MEVNIPTLVVCGVSLFVASAGCSHKSDANSELEKAASVMEQAAPAQPAPPVPTSVQTEQPPQPEPAPAAEPAPAQEMKQAVAAYKSGDLQDAVTRLQKLRATPAMTPQQRIALNDAMAAVMSEIYGLAEKGDARAIQAVKKYEEMQTQPH
jgi:outer membrane protein assembly factor BamD (BamD/ComL family)